MRIQYCSDLHLEFENNNIYVAEHPLVVSGDVLILAGDIVPLHDEFLTHSFFDYISQNYKMIFWVPGNHEFYYSDLSEFKTSFNTKLKNNIHLVNNVEVQYENVKFIFSTLWSKISRGNEKTIEQSVSDFECITNKGKKLKAEDFNKLHNDSLTKVKEYIKTSETKTVVVTHHLPSQLCNLPAHNSSPINEAFCVDLTDYIEQCNANFWIYGHSHFNQKPLYLGNTILLTNQLGYVHCNEHASFKRNAYFSI